jgi:hypothetical protein
MINGLFLLFLLLLNQSLLRKKEIMQYVKNAFYGEFILITDGKRSHLEKVSKDNGLHFTLEAITREAE